MKLQTRLATFHLSRRISLQLTATNVLSQSTWRSLKASKSFGNWLNVLMCWSKTLYPGSWLQWVWGGKTVNDLMNDWSMLRLQVCCVYHFVFVHNNAPITRGYGQTGPYRKAAGYDVIIEAEAGLMHMWDICVISNPLIIWSWYRYCGPKSTGEPDRPPVKVGVAATDIATGLYTHGAIMAGLLSRQQTGKGLWIDCNLFETQVRWAM